MEAETEAVEAVEAVAVEAVEAVEAVAVGADAVMRRARAVVVDEEQPGARHGGAGRSRLRSGRAGG